MSRDLQRLRRLARLLGWDNLRRREHIPEGTTATHQLAPISVWYESDPSETGVWLQINENPTWCATVYAVRYRICTGFHRFVLKDKRQIEREAKRLATFLSREWFDSIESRRVFRRLHPECAGYTWDRLQRHGPPYYCD